jgi:methylaspartate ammonia-lyase
VLVTAAGRGGAATGFGARAAAEVVTAGRAASLLAGFGPGFDAGGEDSRSTFSSCARDSS